VTECERVCVCARAPACLSERVSVRVYRICMHLRLPLRRVHACASTCTCVCVCVCTCCTLISNIHATSYACRDASPTHTHTHSDTQIHQFAQAFKEASNENDRKREEEERIASRRAAFIKQVLTVCIRMSGNRRECVCRGCVERVCRESVVRECVESVSPSSSRCACTLLTNHGPLIPSSVQFLYIYIQTHTHTHTHTHTTRWRSGTRQWRRGRTNKSAKLPPARILLRPQSSLLVTPLHLSTPLPAP